eukprot:350331-Chlamydomonas_euryale.AAC.2
MWAFTQEQQILIGNSGLRHHDRVEPHPWHWTEVLKCPVDGVLTALLWHRRGIRNAGTYQNTRTYVKTKEPHKRAWWTG